MKKILAATLIMVGAFDSSTEATVLEGEYLNVVTPDNNSSSSNVFDYSRSSGIIGSYNYLWDVTNSLVIGDSIVTGEAKNSLLVGVGNSVGPVESSFVMGTWNDIAGNGGTISNTSISGYLNEINSAQSSLVAGENNYLNSGACNFILGRGIVIYGSSLQPQVVVGGYNVAQTNQLFVIGNGISTQRRNALEVYQNGDFVLPGGKLTVQSSPTATTSAVVIDPANSQITIGGKPVLTSGSNGYVGIGTSNPSANLHVANNGYALFGPNSSWGQSLRIGGNGNVTNDASVITTDGNLHLDSAPSNAMYLNYYKGTGGVNFGGGQGGTTGIVGSVSAAGDLTMNGKSVLRNNVKIFGSNESWAEGLTIIQSSSWGGIRLTRNDPATGNYEGNWAIGYTGWGGNDFSISNSTGGVQHDAIFHISSSTRNIGIGTGSPVSDLHISGNAKSGSDIGQSGNSNFTVEAREAGRTPGTGAAIGFVVPGNTDGSNRWEQGRILVTPDNVNNGDANGRMYLQTRYYGSDAWRWRDNIVLKSDGAVSISKRQGDVGMGRFTNVTADQ